MPNPMGQWSTKIDATGPDGNVMVVLGTARRLLKEIGRPGDEIEDLTSRVMSAESYAAALAVVREWFPVITDDED